MTALETRSVVEAVNLFDAAKRALADARPALANKNEAAGQMMARRVQCGIMILLTTVQRQCKTREWYSQCRLAPRAGSVRPAHSLGRAPAIWGG